LEEIDNVFENNYFDILPDRNIVTIIKTALSQFEFEKQLKVVCLSDAY